MDGRGYGFSGWGSGGGSSRGSGNYDSYGYKDGGFGGYGGKRGSGGSFLSSGSNADAVIAKINQRLDMLTQLEGGMKGGGRDRFDQYESYDSRSSALGPRDLYRSGNYGYGDSRGMGFGAMGGGFDSSSYGSAKMRQARDAFSGSGWGAGQRSPRRGGAPGGRGFGRRQDHSSMGGGRSGGHGHSPSGRGKLPSLLAPRMFPDSGAYQPQDYGRNFGGGPRANRQRTRKRPLNRQQVRPQRDGQKKRKQNPNESDEPESKMGKTDTDGDDKADAEGGETNDEKKEDGAPATESEAAAAGTSDDPASKEENSQGKTKPQGKQTPSTAPKFKKRRGLLERLTFACSICKFRSFYSEEMAAHLESKFHKDHFRFLSNQLSKPTTDFLQEYLNNKYKKTEQRVNQMENHTGIVCQLYREQDLTREIGMEHFMKKVEAAHCAACDLFIPMQHHLIQKHLKSPDHNYNRKGLMEQCKRSSLSVARSILNHKVISKKLESYLKGENPFIENPDEQDPEDSMVMEVTEGDSANQSLKEEGKEEGAEPAEEGKGPDGSEAVGNGEGNKEEEEEMKMEGDEAEELGEEEDEELQGEEEEEGVALGEEEEEEEEEHEGDADGQQEAVEDAEVIEIK